MRKIVQFFVILWSGFITVSVHTVTLGQLSENAMGPVAGLGKIMNYICLVAGIGFLLGAIIQYKYHRDNPQQVRLSTPILLLVLGLSLVALPLLAGASISSYFLD